jgi:hypothetical protein
VALKSVSRANGPVNLACYFVGEAMGSTDFKRSEEIRIRSPRPKMAAGNAADIQILLKAAPYS